MTFKQADKKAKKDYDRNFNPMVYAFGLTVIPIMVIRAVFIADIPEFWSTVVWIWGAVSLGVPTFQFWYKGLGGE